MIIGYGEQTVLKGGRVQRRHEQSVMRAEFVALVGSERDDGSCSEETGY